AEVQVQTKATATPVKTATSPASKPAASSSGSPASAQLPQYRPALLTLGPNSVINRIDTAGLIRDGQKDGSLYFRCSVSNTAELKKESDFIGPQPFIGRASKFEGLHYPADTVTSELSGIVELGMKIDATGKLLDLRVVSEYPPLVGFRRAAAEDFRVATFIPA